ncbi:MAG: adenosine deaminase, partial [Anaerolineales bacterium]
MSIKQQTRTREFYKSLPKVELHRHLEGSLRLSTMLDIARAYKLDLPYDDELKFSSLVQVVNSDKLNFQNFLSKFATLRKFYQSPEAIRRIARETIIDAAADNIRYLELRFTPVALTRIKEFPMSEAIDWVIEEVMEASKECGVMTQLIASVNRHESVKLAEEVMQLAVDRIGKGVVGLDLAGSEAEYPGEEFKYVFNQAKESGLKVTIHAGEWGGPEIIKMAIETLSAARIGHGVRVMEDATAIDLAKERRVAFEVCPTSNYQSGVITAL